MHHETATRFPRDDYSSSGFNFLCTSWSSSLSFRDKVSKRYKVWVNLKIIEYTKF